MCAVKTEIAIYAGGCFWCTEAGLKAVKGVIDVKSGYCGGNTKKPSYEEVSSGTTGHYESVKVEFNPKIISYEKLVELFFKTIDPLDANGQFFDKGGQYKTAIFYVNEEQKEIALKARINLSKQIGKNIVTDILPLKEFYLAENYHQDYANKNPTAYLNYSTASGRKDKLKQIWKK